MFGLFDYSKPTPLLTLWCVFLYILIVYKYNKEFVVGEYINRPSSKNNLLIILIIMFAMTCFCNGDFFNTIDEVKSIKSLSYISEDEHMELFYQYLSLYVGGNYWLWRFFIWGSATIFIYLSAKMWNIDGKLLLYVMFTMFAVNYSYSRSTLAQSICIYGISIVSYSKFRFKKFFPIILGISLMIISPIFHRSMYMLIGVSFITIVPFIYKIRTFKRFLLAILGICISISFIATVIMTMDVSMLYDANTIEGLRDYYADLKIENTSSTSYIFLQFLNTITTILIFIFIVYAFYFNKKKINKHKNFIYVDEARTQGLLLVYVSIILISYGLKFMGSTLNTFSYRFLIMSFIPCSILVSLLWYEGRLSKKDFRVILLCGGINTFSSILYSYYNTIF